MRICLIVSLLALISACNDSSENKKAATDTVSPVVQMPPQNALPDTIFTAFGTEPFWAVYVIRDNKIVFHPADGPSVEVPFVASDAPDSLAAAYRSSSNRNSIELLVYKRDCSDGMSEETHRYEVKLQVNKKNYAGCGREE